MLLPQEELMSCWQEVVRHARFLPGYRQIMAPEFTLIPTVYFAGIASQSSKYLKLDKINRLCYNE